MPRTRVDFPHEIQYLSILDPDAHVDTELDPNLDDALLRKLYRAMVLSRIFDGRLIHLQRQGRIGTFPPITGQEAATLGSIAVLRPSDWMVPSFRETPAEVWRGRSLSGIIFGNNGFSEGGYVEPGRNDLPVSIPVGSQTLHAVGIAWAMKYRGLDDVVMTYFGDGATSEGDFHEALNFAGVFQLPVIFVCQNNQWAISIPRSRQTRSKTIAQKAVAYGIQGIQVDGNDILAVYAAAREAVERARSGGGPTLIECETYRLLMHTTSDDPRRYRSESDVDAWQVRDPLKRFEKYLVNRGLLDDAQIETTRKSVETEVQEAIADAELRMREMGDPMDMFNHVYAQLPPHLMAQRSALEREMAASGKEASSWQR